MAEDSLPELTEEQKTHLGIERFIAESLKIRNPKDDASSISSGKWKNFVKFLETTAGTALITVVLGGIMGSLVSFAFQFFAKERELALLASQQRIEKRQKTIETTFDLIGTCFAPADALVRFRTEAGNNPTTMDEKDKPGWEKDWEIIRKNFEEGQRKWSSEEKKAVLLLSYYFNDSKYVKESWKEVNQSLTDYFDYVAENCRDAAPDICKGEDKKNNLKEMRSRLKDGIEYLGCTIEEASKDKPLTESNCKKTTSSPTSPSPTTQSPSQNSNSK